jgi:protein involved in polysaccharide export with SLBB domain
MMRYHSSFVLAIILLFCFPLWAAEEPITEFETEVIYLEHQDAAALSETIYRLGIDDAIKITVLGNLELSGVHHIDPEGYLHLPYLNDFVAVGLTLRELRNALTTSWEPYLGRLEVGIEVYEYNSCKIYVLGEVKAPGRYAYRARISLIEALSLAGGFYGDPVDSEVAIIRVLPDKIKLYVVNAHRIFNYGEAARDITLSAGDIVYVPRTFIGDWNNFLYKISPSLGLVFNVNRLYNLIW